MDESERPVPQDYVTEHEFERWMRQTSASLDRIEGLQRAANSKTAANSEAIAVIIRRLDVIEREDAAIEATVRSVQEKGCNQLEHHAGVMQIMNGVEGASVAAFDISRWSRRTKVAAGVGVGVALWPAVTEIAKLLYTLLQWFETHPSR
jgi:hypothetical protein